MRVRERTAHVRLAQSPVSCDSCKPSQVYRLNTESLAIERVPTSGEDPGWSSRYAATVGSDRIVITGDKVEQTGGDYVDQEATFAFDPSTHRRSRLGRRRPSGRGDWIRTSVALAALASPLGPARAFQGGCRPLTSRLHAGSNPRVAGSTPFFARLDVAREASAFWSGRLDSNQRPLDPQSSALPSCATPRRGEEGTGE